MIKPRVLHILLLGAVVALFTLSGQPASAQGSISSPSNVPSSGTANSVFRFSIQYSDQSTPPILPTLLELHIGGTVIDFPLGDPMFQKRTNLFNGVEFFVYVSGGLDQANQFPYPPAYPPISFPYVTDRGFFLPDERVFYVPDLHAKGGGDPNDEIEYWWYMRYPPTTPGGPTIVRIVPSGTAYAPTIHDSSSSFRFDAYNGLAGGHDWMYAFPDGWPWDHDIDPLDVTNRTFRTPGEDPTQFPDEGSSTNTYTFGVTYKNERGLRARAWMLHGYDYWVSPATSSYSLESGVMLYIRSLDYQNLPTEAERLYWKYFRGHHMYKEDFTGGETPCNYILRVGPMGPGLIGTGPENHWMTTWAETDFTNRYYEALPPGRYEYYFACSDDDYSAWTIDNAKNRIWPQLEEAPPMPTPPPPNDFLTNFAGDGLNYKREIYYDSPPSATTWTALTNHVVGDFVVPTTQNGRKYVCYLAGRTGSSEPSWPLDYGDYVWDGSIWWVCAGAERPGSYVDKKTYMPGAWTTGYPYDSWQGQSFRPSVTRWLDGVTVQYQAFTFPIVNPGLFQIGGGSWLAGSNQPIGGPRFLGTLSPYKRAVNPLVPNQDFTDMRLWAETAGGTTGDVFTFKVNYWHSAGVEPTYVRLFVKNGWNADDGLPWSSYSMLPSLGQTLDTAHYKSGVIYECRLLASTLGKGPHCYYFEAADRQWTDVRYGRTETVNAHICRFPRRPDSTYYFNNVFYDATLPNKSPTPDVGDQTLPVENDIINGPFINTRPQLITSSPVINPATGLPYPLGVSPSSGPAGTNFRFRITYKDPDNQRPYSRGDLASNVIIETDDAGSTFSGMMVRAVPSANDPAVPADNLAREYRDGVVYEWNTSSAPDLRLQIGNRRYRFAFTDNWGSPVENDDNISGETVYAPGDTTPSGWAGSFMLTSNSAPRLTNGSVRSADGTSNDATTWNYMVTYIDADNQSPQYILVFIGRQDNPGDAVTWDSGHAMQKVSTTEYNHGVQYSYSTKLPGNGTTPIKYYHCFVASDGIDPADYNATTSPSSGMIWKTAKTLATTVSPLTFTFARKPLVTNVPPSSELLNPTNYVSPLIYNGATLLASSQFTLNNLTGTVTLGVTATPPVSSKYWFGTEPGSSGPGAVGGNNAPTLEGGQVAPAKGQSTTTFTYTITYKDLDGQAPQFVNVVIDAYAHPMANVSGSTTYKEGVSYVYSTTLNSGNHTFYFEASDGSMLTVFEADPSTTPIDPIEGPYVNDHPTFSLATISPGGSVSTGQAITYSITYRDNDNEGPNSGYPIVYIDNPTEQNWVGTAGAVGDNFIKSSNPTENWTPNQFAGMPVQVTLAGTFQRIVYKILSNTKDTLTLVATDVSSVVTIGSQFDIGKFLMGKQDLSDQVFSDPGGVIYEAKVPSLGAGTHKAHFRAVTTEVTMPGQTEDYTLRYPATGDMPGPTVSGDPKPGNHAPTLTNGGSSPQTGTAGTPFRFAVTYTDEDGDPPNLKHDEVVGHITLTIEETPGVWNTYPMTSVEAAPSYSLGAEFAYTLTLTSVGAHQYYFDASDGWVSVRLPSSGFFNAYISRPPVLTQGLVAPTSGNTGRVFEYKVKYTDPDNNPPASIKLYVDGNSPIEISVPQPGANYANGVTYSYPTTKGSMAEGLHTFYFTATDGYGYAWCDDDTMGTFAFGAPSAFTDGYPATGSSARTLKATSALTSTGGSITFTVTGKNQNGVDGRTWTAVFTKPGNYTLGTEKALVPTVTGDILTDVTGISANAWTGGEISVKTADLVKNSATSTPPSTVIPFNGPSIHSNTAPTLSGGGVTPDEGYDLDSYTYYVTYKDAPDGDEPEFVEVYIDGADSAHAYRMDPVGTTNDYAAGVQYRYTKQGLAPSVSHSFFFKTSDWLAEVTTSTVTGKPVVHARAAANITLTVPSTIVIGNEIRAEGYITGYGGAPLSVDLNLALTKPGGAVTNVTVRSSASGYFQYSWTPTITGVWSVQVSWAGNSQYQLSTSPIKSVTATGPSTTVSGLDMISIPLTGISITPEGVFGGDPAFALAKWLPAKAAYKLYSLLPGIRTDWDFVGSCPISTGQAYWIKTLAPKVVAPSGGLLDVTQDFSIPLIAGWNQIGCPFNREVDWSSLRVRYTVNGTANNVSLAQAAANGWVKDYGWMYDKASGNYVLVRASTSNSTLTPWKGYWLKANASCTLVVPGFRSVSGQLTTSSLEADVPSVLDNTKWQVIMTARNGELSDKFNYFGASRMGDERIESPACFEGFVDLYFTTNKGGMYAGDLRGNLSTGDSWLFNVDTDREGEVVLDWDGLEKAPGSIKLVLVDLAENKSIEITPGGSYRFSTPAGGGSRSFRIDYQSK